MLFNSLPFLVFFAVFYLLYVLLQGRLQSQNRLLLIASCIFYACWDWRFVPLMFFSIAVDYGVARAMDQSRGERTRNALLGVGIGVNLAVLGFFKYFNFFASNAAGLLRGFGIPASFPVLNIILPLGISFYTFQAIGYVVDVYRREVRPVSNFWDYATFICCFPQFIAGPIERASRLLPQIQTPRTLSRDQFYEGSHLFFWGLIKKAVIADNLAKIVDPIFASQAPYGGLAVLIGLYAYSFQIYCDFSGYSDMARGLGRSMGFNLSLNFNLPYFAANPKEFWQKWHISLSSWMRDYVYIPLGGNRKGKARTYFNLFVTMLAGGLWHGASWTFVAWGAYHGVLIIIYHALKPYFEALPRLQNRLAAGLVKSLNVIFFFHLMCVSRLFFRAGSLTQAARMWEGLTRGFHYDPHLETMIGSLVFFTGILLVIQAAQLYKKDLLALCRAPRVVRTALWICGLFLLTAFGSSDAKEFIYFQF